MHRQPVLQRSEQSWFVCDARLGRHLASGRAVSYIWSVYKVGRSAESAPGYARRIHGGDGRRHVCSALVGELLSKGAHSATVLSTRLKVRTYEPSTDLFSEMMRSVERSYFLVIVERELSRPLQ